jgi:hypothetical protein
MRNRFCLELLDAISCSGTRFACSFGFGNAWHVGISLQSGDDLYFDRRWFNVITVTIETP